MAKSFHSQLRDALDDAHMNGGRLATRDHYAIKRAMREAQMSGRVFEDAESLALYIAKGRRYA